MLIGATMGAEDIASYKGALSGNHIMRIFPTRDLSLGGSTVKLPPEWTDSRVKYCESEGVIPFFSSKGNGTDAFVAWMRDFFVNMPTWVKTVYYCDWHEPEKDYPGTEGIARYKSHQLKLWTMIQALPAAVRAKVRFGPVLTKQWTEDSGKGNFNYKLYDPGPQVGDFFGVDSYVLTSVGGVAVSPTTLVTPANFLQYIKAYRYDNTDARMRFFPEMGLIGMPADTTGSSRATWIQGVHNELLTWKVGAAGWTQPWSFGGWIWWHQMGKATGNVTGVGQRRDFPLHLRTVTTGGAGTTASPYTYGAVTLPGSPPQPIATYNSIWTTENAGIVPPPDPDPDPEPDPPPAPPAYPTGPAAMLIGATLRKEDIAYWEPRLARNEIMRVFPNSDGLPPAWSDPRFEYLQRVGGQPFISSNIDGDASKFPALVQHLINMPGWITTVYITDRHEPENNFKFSPETYFANYRAWWTNVILQLPAAIRAKVKAGPVLTRQWIEEPSKGNNNWAQYDPGLAWSDFYAVDMYMNSWQEGGGPDQVATSYKNPVTFLAGFKAYRLNSSDTRPRLIPELGAIGIPADTDGALRAAWIRGLFLELDTWTQAAQGWPFLGAIWWNNTGTSGGDLAGIGTARYFQLDRRQNGTNTYVLLPGNPAAPVIAYNQVALAHAGTVDPEEPEPTDPPPDPTPPPVVSPPTVEVPVGGLPVDGPEAARLLRADYTVLVTDANLQVLGDPIHEWSTLQAAIRWKEPGSGQITVPAHRYIRQQLVPGCRIVVLRRLLGTQHVLVAGPMEKRIRERADDGEHGGVGSMTVSFVDDSAWLGARLAFPNPALAIDQQTTDYWTFNGNPEMAMLTLVDTQAGPGALVARRVPKLRVAAYSGVATGGTVALGPTSDVVPRERLEKLTDVLRKICTLGANPAGSTPHHPDSLGFRVRQTRIGTEDVLLFEPLRSRDLSGEVHFSFARGNLKYYSYEEEAPKLTHPMVGGSGEGADRFLRELPTTNPDPLAWGRFEGYVSRPGTDTLAQMQDAATGELADKGVTVRLASNASDTVDQRYGIHYNAGDVVSVELDVGEYEVAPVQTVNLQAWPTAGEVVGITIGDQSARSDKASIQRLRDLDRRISRLERV